MSRVAEPASAAPTVQSMLDHGVLTVTLNRPERLNALTFEMERLYIQTLLDAADDPAVRVIVVTGAGRAFCSGADLAALDGMAQGAARPVKLRRHFFTTLLPKPVLAAVNGPCVGVGFAMAMMCDMRFAGASVRFGPGMARLGLPAEYGSEWLLARTVGLARAFEVLTSGSLLDGQACLRLGLVNEVLPDESLLALVQQRARDMAAACSPQSLAMMKTQLHRALDTTLAQADALGERLVGRSVVSADFAEAGASRREKRAAVFAPLGARADWWGAED